MQSHHLLSSIFSFSLFLLVFHVPTSSSQADNYDICAPFNFRCGEINHTIKYPFWVDGRSSLCAFPGYNFTCHDNSLMIQMQSETYVVKRIDYDNNILTIVDTDFVDQTCPISTNATIEYGYFNHTDDQVRNLTLYYNCTTAIEPSGFRRLPCYTEPNKYAYFTVRTEFDMPDTFADCAMSVNSIHETNVGRLEDDPRVFRDVLQDGFNVTWIVSAIWCKQCVSSGGRCGFREGLYAEPTCYCKDGVDTTACPGIDPFIDAGDSGHEEPGEASLDEEDGLSYLQLRGGSPSA